MSHLTIIKYKPKVKQRIRMFIEKSQEEEDEIKEVEDRNDQLDKERNIEESTNDEDERSDNHKNNNNQGLRIKITRQHNK